MENGRRFSSRRQPRDPLPFCFSPRLAEGQKGLKVENKAFFSRLTFFNVSEQDYGNYTCVASNQLGNTNASMILYGE